MVLGGEVGQAGGAVLAARVERRLVRMSPLPAEVRASALGGGGVLRGALLTAREVALSATGGETVIEIDAPRDRELQIGDVIGLQPRRYHIFAAQD